MIPNLASTITKAASKQTYYTIRLLVDHGRTEAAYRAYAYFRWLDDLLDADPNSGPVLSDTETTERKTLLERQKSLLERCYQGESPQDTNPQEKMLVELVQNDHEKYSGLQTYLHNMMRVLDFDAGRRGRLISKIELDEYTHWLASSVTEAMHYFIGQGEYAPYDETRYLAVSGAHIAHMLRDTFEDVRQGYFNIPHEILEANSVGPQDVHSNPYRTWVKSRVELAREDFKAGRTYLARIQNPRARIAGFAYMARFEWLLDTIEREDYYLRPQYHESKSLGTGLRMSWLTLAPLIQVPETGTLARPAVWHPRRKRRSSLTKLGIRLIGK